MGCSKNNTYMKELIHFMELNISQDFTDQTKILGNFDRWLNDKIEKNIIKLVDGLYIGIKNKDGTPILLDDLMGEQYLNLNDESYGILIPVKQLLLRRKYEYYSRLSKIQILEANCILSKHIFEINICIEDSKIRRSGRLLLLFAKNCSPRIPSAEIVCVIFLDNPPDAGIDS